MSERDPRIIEIPDPLEAFHAMTTAEQDRWIARNVQRLKQRAARALRMGQKRGRLRT